MAWHCGVVITYGHFRANSLFPIRYWVVQKDYEATKVRVPRKVSWLLPIAAL